MRLNGVEVPENTLELIVRGSPPEVESSGTARREEGNRVQWSGSDGELLGPAVSRLEAGRSGLEVGVGVRRTEVE